MKRYSGIGRGRRNGAQHALRASHAPRQAAARQVFMRLRTATSDGAHPARRVASAELVHGQTPTEIPGGGHGSQDFFATGRC